MLCQSNLISVVIAQGSVLKKTSRPFYLPEIVAERKEKRTTNIPIENPTRRKIFCLKSQFAVLDKFIAISVISQRRTRKPVFLNERKRTNRVSRAWFLLFLKSKKQYKQKRTGKKID